MVSNEETSAFLVNANCGRQFTIDAADAPLVLAHKWMIVDRANTSYVLMSRKHNRQYLHRMLMGLKNGDRMCVDHIDNDGTNCQRKNMRLANWIQNAGNTRNRPVGASGYIGVHILPNSPRFAARIRINGEKKHLGMFDTLEEAARAYDSAALEKLGEFATLNFPEG